MKTEYKYTYFTRIDPTHWLCNAPNGIDLGQIYWSSQCKCFVYDQPDDVASNVKGLVEIFLFMRQL